MAKNEVTTLLSTDNTRDQLLLVALSLFSEKGFEATSVREICDSARANVSAIKYHFGSKEDLYRECFKHFGESRLSTISSILSNTQSRSEFRANVARYCHDFIESSIANMALTKMVMREIEAQNPLIEDIFQETFLKIFQTFANALNQAKKYGHIRENLDTDVATSLFFIPSAPV